MLSEALTVAHKEMLDSARDVRSLISSVLYCLVGPGVVLMVSLTEAGAERAVLTGMASVFILVSAFTGGMNIAMDTLAGERERRSLLPLLTNPIARRDVILGKWLATSFFSTAGLIMTLGVFAILFANSGLALDRRAAFAAACGLIPLALFAAALELVISTVCRTVKEAHTYLSLLVFLPMISGMVFVFFPEAVQSWTYLLPMLGQEQQLLLLLGRGEVRVLELFTLGLVTVIATACVLFIAANRLERDDVVYGN